MGINLEKEHGYRVKQIVVKNFFLFQECGVQ